MYHTHLFLWQSLPSQTTISRLRTKVSNPSPPRPICTTIPWTLNHFKTIWPPHQNLLPATLMIMMRAQVHFDLSLWRKPMHMTKPSSSLGRRIWPQSFISGVLYIPVPLLLLTNLPPKAGIFSVILLGFLHQGLSSIPPTTAHPSTPRTHTMQNSKWICWPRSLHSLQQVVWHFLPRF